MKKISDYLHLYMGCRMLNPGRGEWTLHLYDLEDIERLINTGHKPLLRPLSSMTEDERTKYQNIYRQYHRLRFDDISFEYDRLDWNGLVQCHVIEQLNRLPIEGLTEFLKDQFDIFNLIKDGLALEKIKSE